MLSHELMEAGAKALSLGLLGWLLLRVASALWHGTCELMRMGLRAVVTICVMQAAPMVSKPMRWAARKVQSWQQQAASETSKAASARAAAHKPKMRRGSGRAEAR